MKIISLFISGSAMLAALHMAQADGAPETFKLTRNVPGSSYDGTVEYARSSIISFDSPGRLAFVAPVGRYVQGEILNSDGTVAIPGGLLAQKNLTIPQADVDIAQVMINRAEVVLEDSEINYKRNKELWEKNAMSLRDFQESQTLYSTAVRDKAKSELELVKARRILEDSTRRSPFNAVVTETYLGIGGSADTATPILKISMIDPVRVRFRLPPEARSKLSDTAKVLIYPVSSDTPVVGWLEQPVLSTEEMYCYVDNPRSAKYVTMPDGSQLPSVDSMNPVRILDDRDEHDDLWVPEETVYRDDGEYFVWRLLPLNAAGEDGIPDVFTAERVKIEPSGRRQRYGYMLLIGIDPDGGLSTENVLAGGVPEDLKDGSTVIYRQKFHPFQIGDTVRIELDAPSNIHEFSIPVEALYSNSDNHGLHVNVREDGAIRTIPVAILDRENRTARIFSPDLNEGMELLLKQQ